MPTFCDCNIVLLHIMSTTESNRQKKIAGVLQRDLVDILQGAARDGGLTNVILTVSKVNVTVDLSLAKVYLSIFPHDKSASLLEGIQSNAPLIKHELAQHVRYQLRKVPDLVFYIDDSLEYIENIENSLKGEDNPIENPDLLDKRKKS